MATTSAEDVHSDHLECSDGESEGETVCMTCKSASNGKMLYCDFCEEWLHSECERMDLSAYKAIEATNKIENILYRCNSCRINFRNVAQQNEVLNAQIEKLAEAVRKVNEPNGLGGKIEEMKEQITVMDVKMTAMNEEMKELRINNNTLTKTIKDKGSEPRENKQTYADKLKGKNTLVIRSKPGEGSKATDSIDGIKDTLKLVQINKLKMAKRGDVILEFPDKDMLNKAKEEMNKKGDDLKIVTQESKKMDPKIMICNVSKVEENDNIIESIKNKNAWIQQYLIGEGIIFKEIKRLKAKGDTFHSIIKCSPKIRKAIYDRGDYVYTATGRAKIFDRYYTKQCYKCQGFGHMSKDCKAIWQTCAKCGGEHKLSECTTVHEWCTNCDRAGNTNNHRTYSSKCPIYSEEIKKAQNNTDHGF